MSTLLYYNDILVNSGNQPVPLFGESENAIRFGEKWTTNKVINLNFSLTGCTYNSIMTAKSRLETIFSKDFQPFRIIENGQTIYQTEYNIIRDLNFDSSSYIGVLNCNVTLENYPRELFSGYQFVLDPVNEWNFVEDNDQLITVNHRVSARGLNSSSGYSNAFDNAKNYVLSLTGTNNFINPYFIDYCTGVSFCRDTFTESIDRFNNTYSIEEKYILDRYNGGAGYIRYSTNYECNALNGAASLTIQGNVQSCKNADLATLRAKYQSFDLYSAAVRAYFEACGRLDLNPNYLSSGITEDVFSKKINFNVNFDNDFSPRTFFEYETDIQIDDNDITTVGIKGTIKSRGDLKNKYLLVENYFNTQLNLYYLAYQSYNEFYNNNPIYPLNPRQLDYSVTKNQFVGEIYVATSYNNKDLLPPEFQNLDYSISVLPAIRQIKCLPLVNLGSGSACNSNYYCVDLGFHNRAQIGINGRATAVCTGTYSAMISGIKNLANYWLNTLYYNDRVFLDKYNISQTNDNKGLNFGFNVAWSMDAKEPATVSPYNFIDTLSLN